jgi:hypothetical protein
LELDRDFDQLQHYKSRHTFLEHPFSPLFNYTIKSTMSSSNIVLVRHHSLRAWAAFAMWRLLRIALDEAVSEWGHVEEFLRGVMGAGPEVAALRANSLSCGKKWLSSVGRRGAPLDCASTSPGETVRKNYPPARSGTA